jgi:hypothetical protein
MPCKSQQHFAGPLHMLCNGRARFAHGIPCHCMANRSYNLYSELRISSGRSRWITLYAGSKPVFAHGPKIIRIFTAQQLANTHRVVEVALWVFLAAALDKAQNLEVMQRSPNQTCPPNSRRPAQGRGAPECAIQLSRRAARRLPSTRLWNMLAKFEKASAGQRRAGVCNSAINTINSGADEATIPGGDSLTARSYAQTVVGYNNIPAGTFTKGTPHAFVAAGPQGEPLFIVGNGDDGVTLQSNAFEVSYDGHTTAFDQNANTNGGGRIPIFGGTYNDNTIIAWGDVTPTAVGAAPTISDFGVSTVTNPSAGVYVVSLSTQLPDGAGSMTLSAGSVTVTVNDDTPVSTAIGTCGYATASHFTTVGTATTFIVRTYTTGSSCSTANLPFFFKVCGR